MSSAMSVRAASHIDRGKGKRKIKVLVVDDSAFMRVLVSDMLNTDPEVEVVGVAKNGVESVEQVKRVHCD